MTSTQQAQHTEVRPESIAHGREFFGAIADGETCTVTVGAIDWNAPDWSRNGGRGTTRSYSEHAEHVLVSAAAMFDVTIVGPCWKPIDCLTLASDARDAARQFASDRLAVRWPGYDVASIDATVTCSPEIRAGTDAITVRILTHIRARLTRALAAA